MLSFVLSWRPLRGPYFGNRWRIETIFNGPVYQKIERKIPLLWSNANNSLHVESPHTHGITFFTLVLPFFVRKSDVSTTIKRCTLAHCIPKHSNCNTRQGVRPTFGSPCLYVHVHPLESNPSKCMEDEAGDVLDHVNCQYNRNVSTIHMRL